MTNRVGVRILAAVVLAALATASGAAADLTPSYLYDLADFTGTVRLSGAGVYADRHQNEVFVFDGGTVRVFNDTGMETYSFGNEPALGGIRDLGVAESGDIYILSVGRPASEGGPAFAIVRCNYRGEPQQRIEISGLTPDFAEFSPDRMLLSEGGFLLVSRVQMLAISVDGRGAFQRGYDLAEIIAVEPKERANTEIAGFFLDSRGNMLFTVPVLFRAFIVAPDGSVTVFGEAGSSPGKFNVLGGIAADERGFLYLTDKLRSCVMVFSPDLEFIGEFGYRGNTPGSLVVPMDVAVGRSGKLYVTQQAKRGVAVFSVALR